jgi:predicted RNase H-related nuclease YkuK (DUF458 family)
MNVLHAIDFEVHIDIQNLNQSMRRGLLEVVVNVLHAHGIPEV